MRRVILGALAAGLIASGSIAQATTLIGSSTDPTAVDGLVVNGVTYNVTFSTMDYLSVFSSGPTFTTPTNAADAAAALAGFFASDGATGLDGNPCGNGASSDSLICQVYVPSDDTAGLVNGSQAHDQGSGWFKIGPEALALDTDTLGAVNAGYDEWAVFTPTSSVPEPGTLLLFGFGLAAAGLVRRHRRK